MVGLEKCVSCSTALFEMAPVCWAADIQTLFSRQVAL